MDTSLLKRYDIAQDVNALYREVLRNVKDTDWYWHTPYKQYKRIDHLVIEELFNSFHARTNDVHWMVEKWM